MKRWNGLAVVTVMALCGCGEDSNQGSWEGQGSGTLRFGDAQAALEVDDFGFTDREGCGKLTVQWALRGELDGESITFDIDASIAPDITQLLETDVATGPAFYSDISVIRPTGGSRFEVLLGSIVRIRTSHPEVTEANHPWVIAGGWVRVTQLDYTPRVTLRMQASVWYEREDTGETLDLEFSLEQAETSESGTYPREIPDWCNDRF